MDSIRRSKIPEVRAALRALRHSTAANLRAFNEAVPHGSWLRRSEIERLTGNLLNAAQRAPQRLRSAPWRTARSLFSCACFKRAANPANPYAGEAKKPDPDPDPAATEIKQPV